MATDVSSRTCDPCKGEGSYIEHVWTSHLAASRLNSACRQVPTAIGESRELGRCAQIRCSSCNGFGISTTQPFANPLRP